MSSSLQGKEPAEGHSAVYTALGDSGSAVGRGGGSDVHLKSNQGPGSNQAYQAFTAFAVDEVKRCQIRLGRMKR